ncbi:MAG: helix-turn-helix transcriptional regulator [Rhizobiaceae bacterium]
MNRNIKMSAEADTIYDEVPDLDTLGGRLSRAREAAGMSTAQLARRLGIKTATLQSWESDRSEPRANRLATMAGILNVSLAWLMHGLGDSPSEDINSDVVNLVRGHLKQMKSLRDKTSVIIERLESELQRFDG